jgi:hypothetical protein
MEEDKAELQQLDCNLATEEEEDGFTSPEGWLSVADSRWNL